MASRALDNIENVRTGAGSKNGPSNIQHVIAARRDQWKGCGILTSIDTAPREVGTKCNKVTREKATEGMYGMLSPWLANSKQHQKSIFNH